MTLEDALRGLICQTEAPDEIRWNAAQLLLVGDRKKIVESVRQISHAIATFRQLDDKTMKDLEERKKSGQDWPWPHPADK